MDIALHATESEIVWWGERRAGCSCLTVAVYSVCSAWATGKRRIVITRLINRSGYNRQIETDEQLKIYNKGCFLLLGYCINIKNTCVLVNKYL